MKRAYFTSTRSYVWHLNHFQDLSGEIHHYCVYLNLKVLDVYFIYETSLKKHIAAPTLANIPQTMIVNHCSIILGMVRIYLPRRTLAFIVEEVLVFKTSHLFWKHLMFREIVCVLRILARHDAKPTKNRPPWYVLAPCLASILKTIGYQFLTLHELQWILDNLSYKRKYSLKHVFKVTKKGHGKLFWHVWIDFQNVTNCTDKTFTALYDREIQGGFEI